MHAAAEDTLPAGTVVGRYTIEQTLGRGATGTVNEAVHGDLRKQVALKTLHPAYAKVDELRARVLREAESAAHLRHPHVVDTFDVGTHDGVPYMVTERLAGEDLAALLYHEGRLDPERAADLLAPVCAAVASAHRDGIVHQI